MASRLEPAFDWGDSGEPDHGDPQDTRDSVEHRGRKVDDPGLLAIFGGLYAAWSIAWVLGIAASPTQPAGSLLDAVMYQFGEFLGMIATPLWFGVVWWLTSGRQKTTRVVWLVVGLVALVPLPLILPVVLR